MKHGWFEIDGVQTGEHTLKDRLRGVRQLAAYAHGAEILDLGCAEGLLGAWLLNSGGRELDGVDKHLPYLETARARFAGRSNITFHHTDFDDNFSAWAEQHLLSRYHIVLCTCIAHKLKRPQQFLVDAASRCVNFFVLHLPTPLIDDARSNHVVVNPDMVLFPMGYQVVLHDVDEKLSRKIYMRME